jgi:chromate transporter
MRSEDIWALFVAFAPLSLMAFGGNLSVLAPIQQQAVDVHGWLTAREFMEYFAISRSSPGPGAMIVTLIGWKVAGWVGALVATLSLYMPSFTLALVVSRVWEKYRGRNWHTALQKGLTPIAAGLILAAIVAVLQLTNSVMMVAIAFASFACFLIRPKISPVYLLAAGGMVAILVDRYVS